MIIKVEAIIREEKLQDVLDALGEMEVHGLTCYQVMWNAAWYEKLCAWASGSRNSHVAEN